MLVKAPYERVMAGLRFQYAGLAYAVVMPLAAGIHGITRLLPYTLIERWWM